MFGIEYRILDEAVNVKMEPGHVKVTINKWGVLTIGSVCVGSYYVIKGLISLF